MPARINLRRTLPCSLFFAGLMTATTILEATAAQHRPSETPMVSRGKYLATIGVCEACHTPPAVPETAPELSNIEAEARERRFRTDPDWFRYLDATRRM